MSKINAANIREYLDHGENETIEFKARIPNQLSIIERLISAFANKKGGSIIFGYNELNDEIVGIDETYIEKLRALTLRSPYKNICSVYTIDIYNRVVAVLDVKKSKKDVIVHNIAYTRVENQSICKVEPTRSRLLKKFIDEIQFTNRNPENTKILELLDELDTNPERVVKTGTILYRCRIITDSNSLGTEKGFFGYGKKGSFVPPIKSTRDMRANYRYIPYLYCANHPYTALVEVRPRLGAKVSVAKINVKEKLTLLDFTMKNASERITDTKYNLLSELSILFSKPVTTDDDILDYIPTQYIAEYAKKLGYDGIAFRSSLTPELDEVSTRIDENYDRYNIVVFNYDKCEAIASNVVNVTRNQITCRQTDSDVNKLIFT